MKGSFQNSSVMVRPKLTNQIFRKGENNWVTLSTIRKHSKKLLAKENRALSAQLSQVPSIQVSGLRVLMSDKARVLSNGQMVVCTKDTGKTTRHVVKVACSTLIWMSTRVIGRMIWPMERVPSLTLMELRT
jgi:hypothetical protein